jgi:hypothetical protein
MSEEQKDFNEESLQELIEEIKITPGVIVACNAEKLQAERFGDNWGIMNEIGPTQFNNAVKVMWLRFSEIQCATNIQVDKDSCESFLIWLKTGNDDDAWS